MYLIFIILVAIVIAYYIYVNHYDGLPVKALIAFRKYHIEELQKLLDDKGYPALTVYSLYNKQDKREQLAIGVCKVLNTSDGRQAKYLILNSNEVSKLKEIIKDNFK